MGHGALNGDRGTPALVTEVLRKGFQPCAEHGAGRGDAESPGRQKTGKGHRVTLSQSQAGFPGPLPLGLHT